MKQERSKKKLIWGPNDDKCCLCPSWVHCGSGTGAGVGAVAMDVGCSRGLREGGSINEHGGWC